MLVGSEKEGVRDEEKFGFESGCKLGCENV